MIKVCREQQECGFSEKRQKPYAGIQRQAHAIQKHLKILSAYEEKQEKNLDLVAGAFGNLMAELFVYRQDMWEEELRKFGFYLGKFIYILSLR